MPPGKPETRRPGRDAFQDEGMIQRTMNAARFDIGSRGYRASTPQPVPVIAHLGQKACGLGSVKVRQPHKLRRRRQVARALLFVLAFAVGHFRNLVTPEYRPVAICARVYDCGQDTPKPAPLPSRFLTNG